MDYNNKYATGRRCPHRDHRKRRTGRSGRGPKRRSHLDDVYYPNYEEHELEDNQRISDHVADGNNRYYNRSINSRRHHNSFQKHRELYTYKKPGYLAEETRRLASTESGVNEEEAVLEELEENTLEVVNDQIEEELEEEFEEEFEGFLEDFEEFQEVPSDDLAEDTAPKNMSLNLNLGNAHVSWDEVQKLVVLAKKPEVPLRKTEQKSTKYNNENHVSWNDVKHLTKHSIETPVLTTNNNNNHIKSFRLAENEFEIDTQKSYIPESRQLESPIPVPPPKKKNKSRVIETSDEEDPFRQSATRYRSNSFDHNKPNSIKKMDRRVSLDVPIKKTAKPKQLSDILKAKESQTKANEERRKVKEAKKRKLSEEKNDKNPKPAEGYVKLSYYKQICDQKTLSTPHIDLARIESTPKSKDSQKSNYSKEESIVRIFGSPLHGIKKSHSGRLSLKKRKIVDEIKTDSHVKKMSTTKIKTARTNILNSIFDKECTFLPTIEPLQQKGQITLTPKNVKECAKSMPIIITHSDMEKVKNKPCTFGIPENVLIQILDDLEIGLKGSDNSGEKTPNSELKDSTLRAMLTQQIAPEQKSGAEAIIEEKITMFMLDRQQQAPKSAQQVTAPIAQQLTVQAVAQQLPFLPAQQQQRTARREKTFKSQQQVLKSAAHGIIVQQQPKDQRSTAQTIAQQILRSTAPQPTFKPQMPAQQSTPLSSLHKLAFGLPQAPVFGPTAPQPSYKFPQMIAQQQLARIAASSTAQQQLLQASQIIVASKVFGQETLKKINTAASYLGRTLSSYIYLHSFMSKADNTYRQSIKAMKQCASYANYEMKRFNEYSHTRFVNLAKDLLPKLQFDFDVPPSLFVATFVRIIDNVMRDLKEYFKLEGATRTEVVLCLHKFLAPFGRDFKSPFIQGFLRFVYHHFEVIINQSGHLTRLQTERLRKQIEMYNETVQITQKQMSSRNYSRTINIANLQFGSSTTEGYSTLFENITPPLPPPSHPQQVAAKTYYPPTSNEALNLSRSAVAPSEVSYKIALPLSKPRAGEDQFPDIEIVHWDPKLDARRLARGELQMDDVKQEYDVIDLTEEEVEQVKREIEILNVKEEIWMEDNPDVVTVLSPADSGIADCGYEGGSMFKDRLCLCGKLAVYLCVCKSAIYCSTECQRSEWNNHKEFCAKYIAALKLKP